MAEPAPVPYSADPTLYLYTSLTAGSSHIITATSRLETILKAHRIPFRAIDVATDEKARMLWGRRSKGKKLPGIVQYGEIVGDLEEIEEWNEYGELKEKLGVKPLPPIVPNTVTPSKATPAAIASPPIEAPTTAKEIATPELDVSSKSKENVQIPEPVEATSAEKDQTPLTLALRQAGLEAAKKASERKASQTAKAKSELSKETSEADIVATESAPTKFAEEPTTELEATKAKVPQKLADEGVKTAIGVVESDSDRLEARTGSVDDTLTKSKSPLSEEVTVASIDEPANPALSAGQTSTHRGSSVSLASKEEIQEIEKSNAIAEESEPEAEAEPESEPEPVKTSIEASGEPVSKAAVENEAIEKSTTVDVTVSTAEEAPSGRVEDPQKQDAKDAEAAGKSVGD